MRKEVHGSHRESLDEPLPLSVHSRKGVEGVRDGGCCGCGCVQRKSFWGCMDTGGAPTARPDAHARPAKAKGGAEGEDGEEDPLDAMLERSGCAKHHFALQDCYHANSRDWRMCQTEMKAFQRCVTEQKKKGGTQAPGLQGKQ
jgi:hypothetical protein